MIHNKPISRLVKSLFMTVKDVVLWTSINQSEARVLI